MPDTETDPDTDRVTLPLGDTDALLDDDEQLDALGLPDADGERVTDGDPLVVAQPDDE